MRTALLDLALPRGDYIPLKFEDDDDEDFLDDKTNGNDLMGLATISHHNRPRQQDDVLQRSGTSRRVTDAVAATRIRVTRARARHVCSGKRCSASACWTAAWKLLQDLDKPQHTFTDTLHDADTNRKGYVD